jgi:hypothetical protein
MLQEKNITNKEPDMNNTIPPFESNRAAIEEAFAQILDGYKGPRGEITAGVFLVEILLIDIDRIATALEKLANMAEDMEVSKRRGHIHGSHSAP